MDCAMLDPTKAEKWLDEVLFNASTASYRKDEVKSVKIRDIKSIRALPKGESYLCVPIRASITYDTVLSSNENSGETAVRKENGRLELFIKRIPEAVGHRILIDAMGSYRREALTYNELIPEMRANADSVGASEQDCYPDVPVCFLAQGTGTGAMIVMEDLAVQGYTMGNRMEGATEDEARLAMRAFAKFHANGIELARKMGVAYWQAWDAQQSKERPNDNQTEPGFNKYGIFFSDPFTCDLLSASLRDNTIFKSMEYALRGSSRLVPDAAILADKLGQYLDVTCGGRAINRYAALTKWVGDRSFAGFRLGDCWLNNMMFKYELDDHGNRAPASIKLLDLQMCQAGSPHLDLHFFFATSASTELYAKRKRLLEQDYYPELFRVLSKLKSPLREADYPFARFWQHFGADCAEYGLIAAMYITPLVLAGKAEVPDMDAGADFDADVFKEMTKAVLRAEGSRDRVVVRFANILRDMVDRGLI